VSGLLSGLVFGALFGFLLQKGRVLRFDRQVGALLLRDATIVKFMFTMILVAMVGVYALHDLGAVRILVLPTALPSNVVGGLVFGAGWALLGYCPGTALGALGEGRYDALWGILGMVAGAALFAEIYPALAGNLLSWGYRGPLTLPQLIGVNHWVIVVPIVAAGTAILRRIR